jgi:hypothetical protein
LHHTRLKSFPTLYTQTKGREFGFEEGKEYDYGVGEFYHRVGRGRERRKLDFKYKCIAYYYIRVVV